MARKCFSRLAAVVALVLCCSACAAPAEPGSYMTIKVMDVGDADAILVLGNDGSSLLIDTGLEDTYGTVRRCLEDNGVEQLDMLIITHPHKDHIGGAMEVIRDFSPKAMYTTQTPHDSDELEELLSAYGDDFTYIQNGDSLTLDDIAIHVISPSGGSYEEINDYSAVLMMEYGAKRFLMMGDAEKEAERQLIDTYGDDLKADFLKAGHHGDNDATSKKFLARVMPDCAAISGDHSQDPDHVTDKVLDKLADVGCQIYRTDEDGTITVTSDGQTIWVSTEF